MVAAGDILEVHRTFRDPAGSVEVRNDGVFRTVVASRAGDVLDFLRSPLASELTDNGSLVATAVLAQDESGLLLSHPRVPFISYPWEWPASLWLAAAELTLDICSQLVAEGWILKDATPLNVLFEGPSPKLVDLLSVEKLEPGNSIWLAYGQFVRTFLLPILAHSQLGWPLQTAQIRRDGFEPEEVYAALSGFGRLKRPALSAVTMPVLLARMVGNKLSTTKAGNAPTPHSTGDAQIAVDILRKRLGALRTAMRRAMPGKRSSTWSHYASTAHHYTESEHEAKRKFVSEVLAQSSPRNVLDVGCNTGVYSRLAAQGGADVVAIDTDTRALDLLYDEAQRTDLKILPLCVDLAYPTAAHGWENHETQSFLARAEGHFDTVMMLAVLHHLLLNSQVPMGHIAALCSRITTHHLVLEWVPPTDPKFIEVLRGREAIYGHITEDLFRCSFREYFDVVQEKRLDNGRILFHMVRK